MCNNNGDINQSFRNKLECVLDQVHDGLSTDTSNVCKHYARCTKLVLERMGIEQTYMARTRVGIPPWGHAWNEVPSRNGTFYIDSFWKLNLWCPTGS